MGILTEDMKRVVTEQSLGFVATVCADGTPNVSPKGTTTVWDDDHLVFADIRSPQTVTNLRTNPAVEVNVVDPILRKGYRFKGTAEIHETGQVFHEAIEFFDARGLRQARDRIQTIVIIRVAQARPLVSPAYEWLSEEDIRQIHLERMRDRFPDLGPTNSVPSPTL